MAVIVADVGGTNCRVAVTGPDACLSQMQRFENDRFASFSDLLEAYVAARKPGSLEACCIAIAGPVTRGSARLTNRDWDFDAAAIARALALPPAGPVWLVNDLVALGHALPALAPGQLLELRAGTGREPMNDQALVAGLGTGFNICLVKTGGAGPVAIGAELGHASLPSSVQTVLRDAVGAPAEDFASIEELFSGRGLARLYAILSGGEVRKGPEIIAAYDRARRDPVAQTVELAARLLGHFAQELVFQYLPMQGIHFAGGAGRGLLCSDAKAEFLAAFALPRRLSQLVEQVPVRVITDDGAALTGAARIAAGG